MHFLALSSIAVLIASASAFVQFPLGEKKPPRKTLPDARVDFDKWQMEGTYAIHIHPKCTHKYTQLEDNNDVMMTGIGRNGGNAMWAIEKSYDAEKKRFRVVGYPIIKAPDVDVQDERMKVHGPFVLVGHEDRAYLLTEQKYQDEPVRCVSVPMKWTKFDPLKEAKFEGLGFEEDHLCHKYTDLNMESRSKHGGKCKMSYSELHLDAFSHEPVLLYLEGKVRGCGREEEGDEGEGGKGAMNFRIMVNVDEFEFGLSKEDEKEMLLPPTIRELCSEEDVVSEDEYQDAIDFMRLFGVDV